MASFMILSTILSNYVKKQFSEYHKDTDVNQKTDEEKAAEKQKKIDELFKDAKKGED